jgi:transaldolase
VAVAGKVPDPLNNRLGIAVAQEAYKVYSELLESARWRRALNAGARPQRLLFASTGTKDPKASDVLYVKELVAPLTVNTMPEKTLQAFAAHGEVGRELSPDGGDSADVLQNFTRSGIDLEALAARLQEEGAAAFVTAWHDLLGVIASKTAAAGKE